MALEESNTAYVISVGENHRVCTAQSLTLSNDDDDDIKPTPETTHLSSISNHGIYMFKTF